MLSLYGSYIKQTSHLDINKIAQYSIHGSWQAKQFSFDYTANSNVMFLDSANPVVRSTVQVPQPPFNSLDNTKTSTMGISLASSPKVCYMRHHPNTAAIWSRQTDRQTERWFKRTLWERQTDTLESGVSGRNIIYHTYLHDLQSHTT